MSDDEHPLSGPYKEVMLGLSGKVGELKFQLEQMTADRDSWARRAIVAETSVRRLRKERAAETSGKRLRESLKVTKGRKSDV
jgi:hypothetical protein